MIVKFRQSHGRIQELLDVVEGGVVPTDAYTKAQADAKFATKTELSNLDAEDVAYDNTASGLTSTDVQNAIDEVHEEVEDILGFAAHMYTTENVPADAPDGSFHLFGGQLKIKDLDGNWKEITMGEAIE